MDLIIKIISPYNIKHLLYVPLIVSNKTMTAVADQLSFPCKWGSQLAITIEYTFKETGIAISNCQSVITVYGEA